MHFNVSSNLEEVLSAIDGFVARQVPFAAALALNDVAELVKIEEEAEIKKAIDRPIGFTQRGIYKTRASKSKLMAEVGVRPIQAGYLVWQVEGGERGPKRRAIPVPVGIVRNSYGNMPKGALAKLLARPDVFIASEGSPATKHLPPGIYSRGKRANRKGGLTGRAGGYGTVGNNWQGRGKKRSTLQLLVAFENSATYEAKRFDFFRAADKKAKAEFRAALERRLAEAIRTAH